MTIDENRMLAVELSLEEANFSGLNLFPHLYRLKIKKELMQPGTTKSSLGQAIVAVDLSRHSMLQGQ